MRRALLLLLLTAPLWAGWPNGYGYRRAITINHANIGSAHLTNFPLLLAGTYSDLASTANGGRVQSSAGYDIVVAAQPDGTGVLNFERRLWSASSGSIVLWVNVPDLSPINDTTIYLFYGNASVTSDQQSPAATWDTNYKGVFHLMDAGADTTVLDSTVNGHNGRNAASTASRSVTGPFAGGTLGAGLTYNGSGDYTDLGNSPDWGVTTGDYTWELWLKPLYENTYSAFIDDGLFSTDGFTVSFANQAVNPNQLVVVNDGAQVIVPDTASLLPGTWYHVAMVKGGLNATWYVNGAMAGSGVLGNGIASSRTLYLGRNTGGDNPANVSIAEVRFSNMARSASWIAASFVNQSSPSTFYSIGGEQSTNGTGKVQSGGQILL